MTEGVQSGRQKGDENVERLRAYLDRLAAGGQRLPERGGKINVSAIAAACGFDRNVLYTNAMAKYVLEQAVQRLGLALPEQRRRAPHETDTTTADPRDRRIQQLEQHNASLKAENGALRAERADLRERVRRLGHIEAHMVETGRRVAF